MTAAASFWWWPGLPYVASAAVTTLAWLVWRAASRPRPFRWSDHRAVTHHNFGGRR